MLGNTDVIFLKNSHISFEKSGRKVMIYGLSEQYTVYKKNGGYRELDQVAEDIEKDLAVVRQMRSYCLHTILFC